MKKLIVSIALCAAFGCSKDEPTSTEKTAAPETEATAAATTETTADQAAAKEAKEAKEETEAERMARLRAEDQQKAKEELARWTDELRAQARKLAESDHQDPEAGLEAIVASPHRVPGRADRDKYRNPVETLMFFGIKPDMTVVEAGAGRGWYSEILAPFLAKRGKLRIVTYDPEGPADKYRTISALRVKDFLAKSPELFGNVDTVVVNPPEQLELGAPGSADMVLAFREMHGWYRRDYFDQYVEAVHEVLEPGGVFGVVQHRAAKGASVEDTADKGYLPEAWVIEKIEQAGFELAGSSEINANPKDTKDYEKGVWTLPPSLRLGDEDRDKYLAIGESDRMTLKFVKKAAE